MIKRKLVEVTDKSLPFYIRDVLVGLLDYFFFGLAMIVCIGLVMLGLSCVSIAVEFIIDFGWFGFIAWLLFIPMGIGLFLFSYVIFKVSSNELL